MISRLKGTLEDKGSGNVIVDVQGVGYGVNVPETVAQRLPEAGGAVTLMVHTHVREDHITLYGFLSKLEKDVFEILMTASGVGPKLALTILSALDAGQILEAVTTGNKLLFNGISGVGKKTVEKLFVEIREKCEKRLQLERGEGAAPARRGAAAAASGSWVSDLEQALLSLGFRDNDIRLAVRELTSGENTPKDFDSALRSALALLRGPKSQPALRGNA